MLSFSIATARVKDLCKGFLKRVQYFGVRLAVGLDPEARVLCSDLVPKHYTLH